MNEPQQQLQDLVERMSERTGSGALLGVSAPLQGVQWQGAAGSFARGAAEPVTIDDGFRIASMSKTFTAVLVMMEVEAGRLNLNDGLSRFFEAELIRRVHPDAEQITLARLLNHTAGLWDFALSKAWFEEIAKDPGRFRAPPDILDWAIDHGSPAGPIGGKHVYSDTGYVLLGRILEVHTGHSYAGLCRQRLFEPLGMTATWLEGHEEPRCSLSHCYGENFDALTINGSADWAAGGHVSTLADLERFLRGLFHEGRLVSAETLDRMLVEVPTPNHHYGLGIGIRREHPPGRPEGTQRLWGHSGHWGSFMFYLPALRATLCGTVNVAGEDNRWIFEQALQVLSPR